MVCTLKHNAIFTQEFSNCCVKNDNVIENKKYVRNSSFLLKRKKLYKKRNETKPTKKKKNRKINNKLWFNTYLVKPEDFVCLFGYSDVHRKHHQSLCHRELRLNNLYHVDYIDLATRFSHKPHTHTIHFDKEFNMFAEAHT